MADAKYTPHWTNQRARENGDGEIVWGPDPFLTPLGEEQAKEEGICWNLAIQNGLRLPSIRWISPFRRAIQTYKIAWSQVTEDHSNIKPAIQFVKIQK